MLPFCFNFQPCLLMWLLSCLLTGASRGSIAPPSLISLVCMKHGVDLHYSLASPFPLPTFARALNTRCQRQSDSQHKRVPMLRNSLVLLSNCKCSRAARVYCLLPTICLRSAVQTGVGGCSNYLANVNSPNTWNLLKQQREPCGFFFKQMRTWVRIKVK